MLKLENIEKIKVDIYGEVLELTPPTLNVVRKFKENSKDNEFEAAYEILKDCGVSDSLLEKMSAEHAGVLIQHLSGVEKK